MTPFITTAKAFCDNAIRQMGVAVRAADAGDYAARQAVTAAPAALDLIAAISPVLWKLEAQLEGKRRDLDLYEGTHREWRENDANELAQEIAMIRFALAKAGCVDLAPVKEAA